MVLRGERSSNAPDLLDNLQAWAENDYNTRIIHSNLAFPLLKTLVDAGDPLARRIFKEEIANRFKSGYAPVIKYLLKEKYLDYLTGEELWTLIPSKREVEILKTLENDLGLQFKILNGLEWEENLSDGILVRNRKVIGLCLGDLELSSISDAVNKLKIIQDLESLEELHVRFFLKEFLESLGNLKNLKTLDLSWSNFSTLQESIGNLKSLKKLYLHHNQLSTLQESIGNLKSLQALSLGGNQLTTLPESIGNLKSLKILYLEGNQFTILPEVIVNLKSLEILRLFNNNLSTLPDSIGNISSLKVLRLNGNELTTLPEAIGNLKSLEKLILEYNKLTTLPELILNISSLKILYLKGNPLVGKLNSKTKSMIKQLKKNGVHVSL